MIYRGILAALVCVCAWLVLGAADEDRVAWVRPPSFVNEADILVLQVRVPRHPENRRLVLMAVDGDDIVRRSDEQLEGEAAPVSRWVRWRLPAGELTLIAAVFDGTREVGRDTHPLVVRGWP